MVPPPATACDDDDDDDDDPITLNPQTMSSTMSAEMLLNPPPSAQEGEAMVKEAEQINSSNGDGSDKSSISNHDSNGGKSRMKSSNHPLLARAQHTLKEQLLERKRELEDQLREKRFVLKKATKRREDAGVKMYGLQKTLSTLQTSLISASEHLTSITSAHIKADEELSQCQKQHEIKLAELSTQREKLEKLKDELNSVGEALKQIEKHNEKIKSDIAINRRVTYATEEDIQKAEKEKREQDVLIAHLKRENERHTEKKEILLAKISAQKRETQVARDALSEAQIEMESIHSEKKQIMAQWQSSLVVLGRCDEALQALHDAIQKQNEQEIVIQGEKLSHRKEIKKEHTKVEQRVANLGTIDNRIKVTQKKIQQISANRLKVLEKYAHMLLAVQDVEKKVDAIVKETAGTTAEIKEVEKKVGKECGELTALEDSMLKSLGDQVTLERSHQKLVQKIMDIRSTIKQEDMITTDLEFEHAQIRNDILKVEQYNQNVRDTLEALETEIKQKLLIVSKMDTEIKRKQSEVDVKSKEIDRLNKQYDKLTINFVDKDQTPWHHMIANITYEISKKAKSSAQLQKQWLTMQNDLVTLTAENNCLSDKIQKLENDKAALVQRNKRLETELAVLAKNIKDLDKSMALNHNMIVRFNDLIAKNSVLQQFLENENFNTHANNLIALKDLESNLVKLEVCLKDTAQEKEEVSADVAELQHHIKLWTSKIAFERQTQDTFMKALVGPMAMTTALKKELDRLRLKLDKLTCSRDKILSSVETRVANRKAIFVKVQAVSQRKASGRNAEQALHIKLVADLRRRIREACKSTDAATDRISSLESKKETLASEIESLSQSIANTADRQEQLRSSLKEATSKRIYCLLSTALYQRMVKRHGDIKGGKWKVKIKVGLEEDLGGSLGKCLLLYDLVRGFIADAPELEPRLEAVGIQLGIATKL